MANSNIDLSDLDPFHSESPKIFQTPTSPSPSPLPTRSTSPLAPPQLPSEAVALDEDPLGSAFSLMSFDRPEALPVSGPQNEQIQAHHTRRQELMADLDRAPWDLLTEEPKGLPESDSLVGQPTSDAAGIPIGARRRSMSRHDRVTSSFSPPRRLSSLMFDPSTFPPPSNTSPHAPHPTVSLPDVPSFHPTSPRLHAADSMRRTTSHSSSPSLSDIWSDFQSADPHPPPTQSHSVPQPGDPLKAAYARQLLGGRSAASLPVKGKQKAVEPEDAQASSWKKEWTYDATSEDAVHPIKLVGVRDGVQRALDEDIAEGIRPHLPPRVKLSSKWTLLYSLDQHGISIQTMYERMKVGLRGADSGIVIVVKDEHGSIFGAYVNEGLKDQKTYYGDGTCFLWKSTPFASDDFRVGSSVKAFSWTGRNSYFVLSESSYLSVGGGDGKFGLWVDGVFEKGFSARSPCFANEPLTAQEHWVKGAGGADEAKFEVVQFECWAVGL